MWRRQSPDRVYYRGVPKSACTLVHDNYTIGKRIHFSGITSISAREEVAEEFAMAEGAAPDEPIGQRLARMDS